MSTSHDSHSDLGGEGARTHELSARARVLVLVTLAAFVVSLIGLANQSSRGSLIGVLGNVFCAVGIAVALWRYRGNGSTRALANVAFPVIIVGLAVVDFSWGGFGPTALVWPTLTVVASVWVGREALWTVAGTILAIISVQAVLLWTGVLRPDEDVASSWILATWLELTVTTAVSAVVASWVYRALRLEKELLAQQSRAYQATVGGLGVGVWTVDLQRGCSTVSREVADRLGIPAGRLDRDEAHARLNEVLEEGEFERLVDVYRDVRSTGRPHELEVRMRGRFPVVWLRVRMALDRDSVGDAYIRAAVQDISVERLREQRRANFLAMMSHELRTPLAGLLGSAELLRGADLDTEHSTYLDTVLQAGDHVRGIFNEILDFARIDAGVVDLVEEPTDVKALLRGAVHMLEVDARSKGLALGLAVDGSAPAGILTDPVRLRQVVVNLVSNAIKYTEEGTVEVSARAVEGRLRIAVTDSGIGISEDDMERIFDPYERGTEVRGAGGQGLGLAISRRIIQRLGGTILCDSVLGEGSTFTVTLPAVEVVLPEASDRSGGRRLVTPEPPARAVPLDVLLVEDEPIIRQMTQLLLERDGHRVDTAVDGQGAIDHVAQTHYDLVLMDLGLPSMTGTEAIAHIGRDPKGDVPHLVVFTADARPEVHDEARRAGADEVLTKPASINTLRHLLLRVAEKTAPERHED